MRYMKALFIPFLVFVSLAVLTACAGSASEFSSAAPESGASRGTTQQSDGFIGGTAGGDEGKAVFATPAPPSVPSADVSTGGLDAEVAAQQQAQQRIIVRTMDIAVIVGDVSGTVDQVAGVATSLGGWVVSASRRDVQSGFIAIRVPAGRLDEAIRTIRGFSQDVESEITTSIDVTDEYVDNTARLRNLEATRDALTALFARAEKVEDALTVQREITRIQSEIEALQGRIQLLEQTSAYSLINVNLRTRPMPMAVDAGSDQVSGLRQPVVFRATLEVPSGITDFVYTWDFGDGSVPVTGTRTAPTTDPGKRVTATVTHAYGDEWDSPYIAQIKITG
ncbi:MAG: DUF4349 domain-containing protein, partial [SAR202 cluster bacterium]|nr:DUF4349 domain-containing protein [SAR202 cluster bacterium]